jgi:hypothetical protein
MTSTNQAGSRGRRVAGKTLLVGLAAAAFAGIGAGTAAAADPEWDNIIPTRDTWYGAQYWAEKEATGTEYSYVAFREAIKPWDSINIPTRSCQGDYLENKDYSPGRAVPRGVEVVEPGGIGVTITKSLGDMYGGPYASGIDSARGQSSATNWGFTSQELGIVLHCTKDKTKAFGGTVDGPSNETMGGVAGIVGALG